MSKHNGRNNVCEMTRRKRRREKGRVREAGGERGEEVAGPAVPFRGEN